MTFELEVFFCQCTIWDSRLFQSIPMSQQPYSTFLFKQRMNTSVMGLSSEKIKCDQKPSPYFFVVCHRISTARRLDLTDTFGFLKLEGRKILQTATAKKHRTRRLDMIMKSRYPCWSQTIRNRSSTLLLKNSKRKIFSRSKCKVFAEPHQRLHSARHQATSGVDIATRQRIRGSWQRVRTQPGQSEPPANECIPLFRSAPSPCRPSSRPRRHSFAAFRRCWRWERQVPAWFAANDCLVRPPFAGRLQGRWKLSVTKHRALKSCC